MDPSDDDGRRQPNNMRGLLKFCMENTKSEDAQGTTAPMDPEKKKWLEEAMKHVQDNDPVKLMKEYIHLILESYTSDEEKEIALQNLNELVDNIDLANDFFKMGGFKMIEYLFENSYAALKWRAADVLATSVQNNPISQQGALDMGLLPILLSLIDTDQDHQVRIKAFYAFSCLVRENPLCSELLTQHDGFSVLVRAIQSDIEKLQLKVAFMLQAMCENEPACKKILCNLGMVEQLVGLLHLQHSKNHEFLMMSLYMLLKDNPEAIKDCLREELQVKQLIANKLRFLQGKEEFQEELQFCSNVMKILYSKKGVNVDR